MPRYLYEKYDIWNIVSVPGIFYRHFSDIHVYSKIHVVPTDNGSLCSDNSNKISKCFIFVKSILATRPGFAELLFSNFPDEFLVVFLSYKPLFHLCQVFSFILAMSFTSWCHWCINSFVMVFCEKWDVFLWNK